MKRYLHYDYDKRQTQPWFADEPLYDSERVIVDLVKGLRWTYGSSWPPGRIVEASGTWEPVEGFTDSVASIVNGFRTERWRGVAYVQHLDCGRWGREGWAHSCGGERGNNWHESPWALERAMAKSRAELPKMGPIVQTDGAEFKRRKKP